MRSNQPVTRAIETDLIHRAALRRASGARSGIVTVVQRFGSAANLNVHLHMLVLDGVYEPRRDRVRFHRVAAPSDEQMRALLDRIIARIRRRLTHDRWLIEDPEHPYLDLEPQDALDELGAASIRYRIAAGPGTGQRVLALRTPSLARSHSPKPLTVDRDGFSLNACVACDARQRARLERVARYVTRPAIALDRLSVDDHGRIALELRHPFRDGTTHVLFTPADWMARLAALVPRPRVNLTRYHEVFAPNCKLRTRVVPLPSGATRKKCHRSNRVGEHQHHDVRPVNDDGRPIAPLSWAERLKRVFLIDISVCPYCGGTLRWIADITDPDLIHRVLQHVRSRSPPRTGLARADHPGLHDPFTCTA